ncbi:aldo/keto reductase [Streptomyces sp. Tue6028]|uniref:aldo/keto reductase n=1 Tax=Streptomyces sp. Tue6028 TaxID=2036037 RepID=UPI003EB9A8F5
MLYQLLGQTGLRVSELFLGAMTFHGRDRDGNAHKEYERIVEAYAQAGGNVIDTAVNYGEGESEEILGELLKKDRDRFVLSTKYTLYRDASDPNASGNHRKNLRLSLETSLRRLRTDYIDLYWVHIWDPNTPIEETMRALDDVVRSGKVLYLGISDTPAWVVARANTLAEQHGWTPFSAVQVPYNLLNRDVEREVLPMAEATGLSVAGWGPLASGALSGKYTRPDRRPTGPTRMSAQDMSPRDRAVAEAVAEVADELDATPSQVAIAWTRARYRAVHPIVGVRTLDQLTDNLGAAGLSLTAEQLTRLEAPTEFSRGFPLDFIEQTAQWVYGSVGHRVVPRGR